MATVNWQMDPAHSEVQFKVKHMMVSNVTGEFKNFEATLESEDHDFSTAKVTFSADIDSVTTRVEQRDNHLKSADFFDMENHPQLTFESTRIVKKDDDDYEMEGNITMRGVTKPITLKVEHVGMIEEAPGAFRTGFEISGKVNRLEHGLNYNPVLEMGGLVVGDKVSVLINAEFTHKA